jgi:hypothetical protein
MERIPVLFVLNLNNLSPHAVAVLALTTSPGRAAGEYKPKTRQANTQQKLTQGEKIMELTPELKEEIDGKSYRQLLAKWRFAPVGDPMFQGESGDYWGKRMAELKSADPNEAVAASKSLGW